MYTSILDGPLFTFTVGCDGQPTEDFAVHSRLISEHSDQLSALINGSFNEARTRHARLDDVDVPTFKRFLEFVYLRSYHDPKPESWDYGVLSAGIVESSQAGQQDLNPESESDPKSQEAPGGDQERHGIDDLGPSGFSGVSKKKTKKSRTSSQQLGFGATIEEAPEPSHEDNTLVSRKCAAHLSFLSMQFGQETFPSSYPALHWPPPEYEVSSNLRLVLLGHAKLYVFAEQRIIPRLRALVLRKLHFTLTKYAANHDNLRVLSEVIQFAFDDENTIAKIDGKPDPFRDMLVRYVITHIDSIGAEELFIELLSKGGHFVRLFWTTLHHSLLKTNNTLGDMNGYG